MVPVTITSAPTRDTYTPYMFSNPSLDGAFPPVRRRTRTANTSAPIFIPLDFPFSPWKAR